MLAKGKAFIYKDELENLFNLPEGVEIVNVKLTEEGFEFSLVSPEAVEGVTSVVTVGTVRRVRVPRNYKISKNKFAEQVIETFKEDDK